MTLLSAIPGSLSVIPAKAGIHTARVPVPAAVSTPALAGLTGCGCGAATCAC
jgi:hypothetical protein